MTAIPGAGEYTYVVSSGSTNADVDLRPRQPIPQTFQQATGASDAQVERFANSAGVKPTAWREVRVGDQMLAAAYVDPQQMYASRGPARPSAADVAANPSLLASSLAIPRTEQERTQEWLDMWTSARPSPFPQDAVRFAPLATRTQDAPPNVFDLAAPSPGMNSGSGLRYNVQTPGDNALQGGVPTGVDVRYVHALYPTMPGPGQSTQAQGQAATLLAMTKPSESWTAPISPVSGLAPAITTERELNPSLAANDMGTAALQNQWHAPLGAGSAMGVVGVGQSNSVVQDPNLLSTLSVTTSPGTNYQPAQPTNNPQGFVGGVSMQAQMTSDTSPQIHLSYQSGQIGYNPEGLVAASTGPGVVQDTAAYMPTMIQSNHYQPANPNPSSQTYTPGTSTQAAAQQPGFAPVVNSWKPANTQPDAMTYTPGVADTASQSQPSFAPVYGGYQPGNPNPNAQTYTPGTAETASQSQPGFSPVYGGYQPGNPNPNSQTYTPGTAQTAAQSQPGFAPVYGGYQPGNPNPNSQTFTPGTAETASQSQPSFAPVYGGYQPGNPNPNSQTYTPGTAETAAQSQPGFVPVYGGYQPGNPNPNSQTYTPGVAETAAQSQPGFAPVYGGYQPGHQNAAYQGAATTTSNVQSTTAGGTVPLVPQYQNYSSTQMNMATIGNATPAQPAANNPTQGSAQMSNMHINWQPQRVEQSSAVAGGLGYFSNNYASGAMMPAANLASNGTNYQPSTSTMASMSAGVVTATNQTYAGGHIAPTQIIQASAPWNYSTTAPTGAMIPQSSTQQYIDLGGSAGAGAVYVGKRDPALAPGAVDFAPAALPAQDRTRRLVVDIADVSQQVFKREQSEALRAAQRKREQQMQLRAMRQNMVEPVISGGQLPAVAQRKAAPVRAANSENNKQPAARRAMNMINKGASQFTQPLRADSPVQSEL